MVVGASTKKSVDVVDDGVDEYVDVDGVFVCAASSPSSEASATICDVGDRTANAVVGSEENGIKGGKKGVLCVMMERKTRWGGVEPEQYDPSRPWMYGSAYKIRVDTSVAQRCVYYGESIEMRMNDETLGLVVIYPKMKMVYGESVLPSGVVCLRVRGVEETFGWLVLTEGWAHTVLIKGEPQASVPLEGQFKMDGSFWSAWEWRRYVPRTGADLKSKYRKLGGWTSAVTSSLLLWYEDECVGYVEKDGGSAMIKDGNGTGMFRCTVGSDLVGWLVLWEYEGVDYVLLNGSKRNYFQLDDTVVQWNER